MRRSGLYAVLATVASSSLLGCFSSSTNFKSPPVDGGGYEEPDGSAPVEDATSPEDAAKTPPPEAGTPDVVEEVAPPQVLAVVVTGPSGPESGKIVAFDRQDGQPLVTATTDATGTVVQQVSAGDQVTIVLGTVDAPNLVTVAGVKPGETLTAFDAPANVETEPPVVAVLLPPYDVGAPSSYVQANVGNCANTAYGEGEGEVDVPAGASCVNASGQFPVLATVYGPSYPVAQIAWMSNRDNQLAPDGGVTTVDLTSQTWSTTFGGETINVANVPDGNYPAVMYTEVANSVPETQYDNNVTLVDAGTALSNLYTHPGYADFVQTEVSLETPQDVGGSVQAVADRSAAPTTTSSSATQNVDMNDALPLITASAIDTTNPAQPTVTWTAAAPLSSATAIFSQIFWNGPDDDAGDYAYGTWTFVVPASQTSIVPPVLDGDALEYAPNAQAFWTDSGPLVAAMNADAFPTYDAFVQTGANIGQGLAPSNQPLVPMLPANGRARITLYSPQNGESDISE